MSGGKGGRNRNTATVKYTVYQYFIGAHLVLCHGPLTELREIWFGDQKAWSGSVTTTTNITISQPSLFGGDKQEGGISGTVGVALGGPTQGVDSYLSSRLPGPVSAWRNLGAVILKGLNVGTNIPYLKNPKFQVKRVFKGWYPERAEMFNDTGFPIGMNPAHIVYECLTNAIWGLGRPATEIDTDSFSAAANTLYDEGLALSFLWWQQDTIESFIGVVMNHISGMLLHDKILNKYKLVLLRNNYDPASVPVLDQSNILSLDEFQRQGWGETINEIVVTYTDVFTGQTDAVTLQNLANIQLQGGVVSETREYPGLPGRWLAQRIAARDLRIASSPLSSCKLTVNRQAWGLEPGSVFKLVWPPLGIDGILMRVAEVDLGTFKDRRISLTAVEDVFSIPAFSYINDPVYVWAPPTREPAPALYRILQEVPYWYIAQALGDIDAQDTEINKPYETGWIGASASPSSLTFNYRSYEYVGGAWTPATSGQFIPVFRLEEPITDKTDQTFLVSQVAPEAEFYFNQLYVIDGKELVVFKTFDVNSGLMTVDRGILDTLPATHQEGVLIHALPVNAVSVSADIYAINETAQVKMATITSLGELDLASAPTDSLSLAGRQGKPFPPGGLTINGTYLKSSITGDLTVSWKHRNRLTQTTTTFIKQTDASLTPEAGTEYVLQIYGEAGTLLTTQTLSGTSYTYLRDTEIAASGLGRPNLFLTVKLKSRINRPTFGGIYESWQTWEHHIDREDAVALPTTDIVLVNPGAEAGSLTGWVPVSGTFTIRSDYVYAGSYAFGCTGAASTYQEIDLLDWLTTLQIDFGEAKFLLSWWQINIQEAGRMAVEFFNATGSLTGRTEAPYVGSLGSWTSKSINGTIPATSRTAKIYMQTQGNGALFDAITFGLARPPFKAELENADGSAGDTTGWTVENGNFSVSTAAALSLTSNFGGYVFHSQGTANFWAGQTINILTYLKTATIDGSYGIARLVIYQNSLSTTQDPAGADIIWLNATSQEIGRSHLHAATISPALAWHRRSVAALIPAGARFAKIAYFGNRAVGGDSNITGYFDNIEVHFFALDPIVDERPVYISNYNADSGLVTPWQLSAGSQPIKALAFGETSLDPQAGPYSFGISPAAPNLQGNYEVYQRVNFEQVFVGDFDIETGSVKLRLSAQVGSETGTNTGAIKLRWLDSMDAVIYVSTHSFSFPLGIWTEETFDVTPPVNARGVEILLASTYVSGAKNDGQFDSVALTVLGVPPHRIDIVNPSAETGNTTGWTVEPGYENIMAEHNNDTMFDARRNFYQFKRHDSAVQDGPLRFYQRIGLAAEGASVTLIDQGRYKMHSSVYTGTYSSGGETGELILRWLDGANQEISTSSVALTFQVSLWWETELMADIPVGARSVDVILTGEQNAGGLYNEARFDDVELVLILTQP